MSPTGAPNVVLQAVLRHAHAQVNLSQAAGASTTATQLVAVPVEESQDQTNEEETSA